MSRLILPNGRAGSACIALLIVSACTRSHVGLGPGEALGIDDDGGQGERRSALAKPGTETRVELASGASLTIPSGALGTAVRVTITRPPDRAALTLARRVDPQYELASAPYVVTPHGLSFETEIELRLPIGERNADGLLVAALEDERDLSWEVQGPAQVRGAAAIIPLTHFSVYALLERVGGMDGGAQGGDSALAPPDTGTDGSTASTYPARLEARLRACDLLAQTGTVQRLYAPSPGSGLECVDDCLLDAACDDIARFLCEGIEVFTPEYQSCVLACGSYAIVECVNIYGDSEAVAACDDIPYCMDGSDETDCPDAAFLGCLRDNGLRVPVMDRCNGNVDCEDGGDEQNCPPGSHFVCGDGRIIFSRDACNGFQECSDGSDEANCPQFTCRDGAQVPQAVTCDLIEDCADGSDEEAGCLRLTCGPLDRSFP